MGLNRKIIKIAFFALTILLLLSKNIATTIEKDWFQKAQIYCMVALPPKDVEKFHITVNGLWNGYFGEISSPFACGRLWESMYSGKTYGSDKEFVEAMHSQGLLVPGTILTTQGHESMQGTRVKELACRSAQGEIPDFDLEAESYFMCAINPGWIDWMVEHGKKAIDAGADLIVLDEIKGNSFFPMFQWAAQYLGIKEPGFCYFCIEGFRKYLKEKFAPDELKTKFNIPDIDKEDLHQRVASTMSLTYKERIAADPLIEVYIDFQEEENYEVKKRLIQALRNYAREKGQKIAISANSFAIGTNRPGGYWSKGLIFSDLVDFYTFENTYTAIEDVHNLSFPRNKWLAWEKLARAATNSPAVILLDTGAIKEIVTDFIEKNKNYNNYLYILFAEAYANQGAFVNYYIKLWGHPDYWMNCAKASDFILNHRDLYDAESQTEAQIGLLFLYSEGMRHRIFSYLGLAQALAESNIPYDVIFGGGGYYLKDRLNIEDIKNYKLIIIPSAKQITSNQKETVKQYVQEGGKAIIVDPDTFGLEGSGEILYGKGSFIVLPTWEYEGVDWDIGSLYFFDYKDWERKEIEALVEGILPHISIMGDTDRKVIAYPYYQQDKRQIVIHLVNYDHNIENDKIIPKNNLMIRIKKPDFVSGKRAYLISPDFNEKISLDPNIQENYIELKIPKLEIYDVIVIGGKGIKSRR